MLNKIIRSDYLIFFLTVLTILTLSVLAYNQLWQYHLAVDIWGFYFPRFVYFWQNHSFAAYSGNEYLPGAMFFFLVPGLISGFSEQIWENYLVGLFVINALLITAHVLILKRYKWYSPIVFLLILFSAGPIILYRHELFVSLFLTVAIICAVKNKIYISAFLLGLSTTIKIFPALIFPYLFIYIYYKSGTKKAVIAAAYFLLGLISLTALYLLFGSTEEIKSALLINSIKPLHAESIWASFLEVSYKLTTAHWIPGKGENGIFGIDPNYIILPIGFYNYFWLVPLTSLYFFIAKNAKKTVNHKFSPTLVFLIILLFIIFSKIITPQYLLWPFLIFPIISFKKSKSFIYIALLSLIALTLLLTQIIYPLNYSELLGMFFTVGERVDLFLVLLLRNILLVIIFVITLFKLKDFQDEETSE